MKNKTRIHALDLIRGLAAIYVALYHYFFRSLTMGDYNDGILQPNVNFAYGWLGVQVFFILSGFVIYNSIQGKDTIYFIKSRFYRLFPLYWICLVITLLFLAIFNPEWKNLNSIEVIINFTMLQGFLGIQHVDGVYWTLMIELVFYFWALSFLLFKKCNYIPEFLLCSTILYAFLNLIRSELLDHGIFSILLVKYSSYFLIGVVFQKIYSHSYSSKMGMLYIGIAILSSCFEIYYKVESISIRSGFELDKGIAIAQFLLFIIVFYLAIFKGFLSFIYKNVCIWFGLLSYPLYLLHQNIGYILIAQIYEYFGFLSVYMTLLIVIIISLLLGRYIDPILISSIKKIERKVWKLKSH